MKIKVLGIDDPLVLKELSVINQGFFDEWQFDFNDGDLVFDASTFTDVGKEEKEYKYYILKKYLEFLEISTHEEQPWGLLNGMRPTKLVHSMKKRGETDFEIEETLAKNYHVKPGKIELLANVARTQLQVIPDLYALEREISIYIGIPFCPTRCAYCTFAAYATKPNKKWIAPFVASLLLEIKTIGEYLKNKKISATTVYLGGGTATSLEVCDLRSVFEALSRNIPRFSELRELTVEAGRPDTITREKLELLREFNVNRISINPQSFNQPTLDAIGRHHSVDDVIEKFELARDIGFRNINMDLIVGLPGEGKPDLIYSLKKISELNPESLTVHMLAFKRKSELTNARGLFAVADKLDLREMANITYDFAKKANYIPYYLYRQKNIAGNGENIGYSKVGHECLYNILMMEEAQNILGLGVGASSKFLIGESVHNPKDLRTYIENYEDYSKRKIEMLELSMKIDAKAFTYNPGIEN